MTRRVDKRRPLKAAIISVLSIFIMTACGSDEQTGQSGEAMPADPATVRIMVYNGAYTSMPVRIAQELGIYKKYNLKPELVTVDSGPAGVAAALGGSIDFIEPPTDQIIQNQAKGVDLKIVVGNETSHFYALIVRDGVPTPRESEGYVGVMKDLEGKRIGVNALGSTTHLMTEVLLEEAGMSPDDVRFVAVGSANTALASWEAGKVDAVMGFTPFREIVEAAGTGRAVLDMSKGDGPDIFTQMGGAFEGFSAKADYIEDHPDIVQAFIDAQTEAIEWMKDPANHDDLVKMVEKHVSLDIVAPEKRDETVRLMIENYNRYLGHTVDPEAIPAWNKYLLEKELISEEVPASEVIYEEAPAP
jgi:NitT/TauT family transport system substrate-binding protein